MNFAPDIRHKDAHTRLLEIALIAYLTESLFAITQAILERDEPAGELDLIGALRMGNLVYRSGRFHGPLSARISKDLRFHGATLDHGLFSLPSEKLTIPLRAAIAEGRRRSEDVHKDLIIALIFALNNMGPTASGIDHQDLAGKILTDLNTQWGQGAQAPQGALALYVLRAEASAKALAEETAQRMKAEVEDSLQLGQSRGELAEGLGIQRLQGKRRAHYVAEREIAAFIAEYRHLRADEIGSPGYFWETQGDSRVRVDHAHLQGLFFRWEAPPVTNTATGDRNHPGEDFNCRCFPHMLRKDTGGLRAKRIDPVKQERVDNEAAVGQISQ